MLDSPDLEDTVQSRSSSSSPRPPSPSLISLWSSALPPTLLEAQDELDHLVIEEAAARQISKKEKQVIPDLGSLSIKSSSSTTCHLLGSDIGEPPDWTKPSLIHLRDGSVLVLRPAKPARRPLDEQPVNSPEARTVKVERLVDVGPIETETELRAGPSNSEHSPPASQAVYPANKQGRRTSRSHTLSSTPYHPVKCQPLASGNKLAADRLVASSTPNRASSLGFRAFAPVFGSKHNPAHPPSGSTGTPPDLIGDIEITPVSKLIDFFKTKIKFHPFPLLPKIFWGKSAQQIERERDIAARHPQQDGDIYEERDTPGGEISQSLSTNFTKDRRTRESSDDALVEQESPTKRHKGRSQSPVQSRSRRLASRLGAGEIPCAEILVDLDSDTADSRAINTPEQPCDSFSLVDLTPPSSHNEIVVRNLRASVSDDLQPEMTFNSVSSSFASASNNANQEIVKSAYRRLLSVPSPRINIPSEILLKAKTDALESSVLRAWKATEPSPDTRKHIRSLLDSLTRRINLRLDFKSQPRSEPRFEVDVFGSVSWGGETGQSGDLDLVILDHDMPYGYEPSLWRVGSETRLNPTQNQSRMVRAPIQALPPVYNLRRLHDVIGELGMINIYCIHAASTPIVKFTDRGGISRKVWDCDINVNDLGGWFNSSLILHYCLISPYVLRPMIYALKRWAAAYSLNDASGANGPSTMSSYCLTLMAIAYLQHLGTLPNLQASVVAPVPEDSATLDEDIVWVGWGKDQGIKAHVGFEPTPPKDWTSATPNLTAAQAIRGFFSFFSQGVKPSDPGGKMNYQEKIISILQGGIAKRAATFGSMPSLREAKIQAMKGDGWSMDEIHKVLQAEKVEMQDSERFMGKGDLGIQPIKWIESPIVVQDPFLWQKNCAAGMSKQGRIRFFNQLDETNRLFNSNPDATLDDMLRRGEEMTRSKPSPLSSRGQGIRGRDWIHSRGTPSPSPRGRGRGGAMAGRLA
ncbi:hypothetical protein BD324DRAFT_679114 [Kockovaella imperatae]|uniref:Poly(A) RNA polymerase mitochondrial-like central palm domain-containing protein n=1 Tax=Kockovaella imperatae TaxID=4999 RepID=A0A1Y1UPU4_9TREE|nr:hypothetical protein BD324DRAFT_679114 [Kockovaella imperatae]ORX40051.1 hypothetical protein BD324DRAFT_679114 [Kockovaella imperatae]